MKIQNPLLLPELLAAGDSKRLQVFCESGHPGEVAEQISELNAAEAWTVLRHAGSALRTEIFRHLDEDLQVAMVCTLKRDEIARFLTEMPHDERADVFKRLPSESRDVILPALAQAEREDIRRLTAHREGTAGAVMTSDYATLSPHLTAAQAVKRLREVAPGQGDDLSRLCFG